MATLESSFALPSPATSSKREDWRTRLYTLLTDHRVSLAAHIYHYYLDGLVILSMITLCLATVPSLSDDLWEERLWFALETFIAVNFILDMVLKMTVSRPLGRYLKTWTALADALSVIPWIAEAIVLIADGRSFSQFHGTGVYRLSALRLLRMLRFARFYSVTSAAFPDMQLFVQAVQQSRLAVVFLMVFVSFSGVFFSVLLYYAETSACHYDRQRRQWLVGTGVDVPTTADTPLCTFQNIFEASWFVMVTITTVGYGDVQLKATSAKIITVVMMICSVIGLSLPVAIFGANLTELYLERRLSKRALRRASSLSSPASNDDGGDGAGKLPHQEDTLKMILSELSSIRNRLDSMEAHPTF